MDFVPAKRWKYRPQSDARIVRDILEQYRALPAEQRKLENLVRWSMAAGRMELLTDQILQGLQAKKDPAG